MFEHYHSGRLFFLLALWFALTPLAAHETLEHGIRRYADEYVRTPDARNRLNQANRFFDFLYDARYIDEPIVFPKDAHIDSVDVNVYYYTAEYFYSVGDYRTAVSYCTRAEECFGCVDDQSKSDVYALKAAACFRLSDFNRVVQTLNRAYALDKRSGDLDRMSSTLNGIASALVANGTPQEAEKYILEAIAVNSTTDNLSRRAVLYGTASEMYMKMADGELALSYAQRALAIERQLGDSARIGIRLSQVANAQMETSDIDAAQQTLSEALPLLRAAGNMHSWGICQNQMGDILSSKEQYTEAADCYREAAALFLRMGDKYNEMHAREGLYYATKTSSPDEAMIHLERANSLRDSIYHLETEDAIARYNALYHIDILQQQKEEAERGKRTNNIIMAVVTAMLLTCFCICFIIILRRHKRKEENYDRDISSLRGKYDEINRLYRKMLTDNMFHSTNLTDDDKAFVSQLVEVIDTEIEKGVSDIGSIAKGMHTTPVTLRRRLASITDDTMHEYIVRVRMQKAKYLLQNYRDITIAEVAERCGYSQVPNFSRAFTRYYGTTPSGIKLQKLESRTDAAPEQTTHE
ncbi:MAG: helix-turn-helix domain-containing protein [Paludibacteraceae bacterium]|nr:helix-turn-helix domain-containing protein [Paludibacteraceae bacterium]